MTGDVNDVMAGSNGLGFLVILNKSSELKFEARRSELIFLTWARRIQFVDCGARAGVGWVSELRADDGRTVSIEKLCVSLSPRVENLNLKKLIKVSYLNQKRVFRVFRIPMRMNIMNILNVFIHPYISRINMYKYITNISTF